MRDTSTVERVWKSVLFTLSTLLLITLVTCPHWASAQVDRATITGRVSDRTSAVIRGVDIVAKNVDTGVTYSGRTNDDGIYSIPNLPIGKYSLRVDKEGFKTFERNGLAITVGQIVHIDVNLEVGSSTTTVVVNESAPLLLQQSEVGTNIKVDEIDDLPYSVQGGRYPLEFAFSVTPTVVGSLWQSHIGGSAYYTSEAMIDGMSTDSGQVGVTQTGPPMEAMAQMQVDATGESAEAGRTGGGAFLLETKSGTNQFHGSAYLFYSNSSFNANTWQNNWFLAYDKINNPADVVNYEKQPNTYDDFGFSVGGPVWIPKVYNGHNKTFFFFAWDKMGQQSWTTSLNTTVPTTDFLQGNFSSLLNTTKWGNGTPVGPGSTGVYDSNGNPVYYGAIFDPITSTVFPDNIIPAARISARSASIIALYQQYYKPVVDKPTQNYPSLNNNYPWESTYWWSLRLDHTIGPNDKVFGAFSYGAIPRIQLAGDGGPFEMGTHNGGPLTTGEVQGSYSTWLELSYSHSFSANIVNVANYVYNGYYQNAPPLTFGASDTNWTAAIGLGNISSFAGMPHMKFGGMNGVTEGPIGATQGNAWLNEFNAVFSDNVIWQKGRNSIKFGGEIRGISQSPGSEPGELTYNFGSGDGIPASQYSALSPFTGFGFANFILGEVGTASEATSLNLYGRRKEYALYASDSYRMNKRLTLDASLRWDFNRPLHEKYGHWSNFNLTAHDPAWGNLLGAETWLTHPGDSFQKQIDYFDFGPRVGASYLLTPKIVLRGGFGLSYAPIGNNTWDAIPYYSQADFGFQAINQVKQVSDYQAAFQWDVNGYPGVITPATGPVPNTGFMTWGPASEDPDSLHPGRVYAWNGGVQYEITKDTKAELNYIGNIGRKIDNASLNPLNFPQWSTYQPLLNSGNAYNWVGSQAQAQASNVPYPYPGFSGYAYMAINPYPQVAQAWGPIYFSDSMMGRSSYNALTFEVIKRKGAGLTLDLSYTFSKTEGNSETALTDTWAGSAWYQDPYAYNSHAHDPVSYDQRHLVKGYVSYVLPLGRGRSLLGNSSRLMNMLVAGWQISALPSYGSGWPMSAVGSTNSYPGWSAVYANVASKANFKNTFKSYNPMNPTSSASQFMNPAIFSDPTYGQLGNTNARYFNQWRGWASYNEDVGLLKNIQLSPESHIRFQLRGEFFDAFNRHQWNGPNGSIDTPYFGQVQGVSGNRTGQLGFHMYW
jgi:hypothetical protein